MLVLRTNASKPMDGYGFDPASSADQEPDGAKQ
jgi:hypothetical protein